MQPTQDAAPLFVIVHGVGNQSAFATMRYFIEGSASRFDISPEHSRAELIAENDYSGSVSVPGLAAQFKEITYSHRIAEHRGFAEQDPKVWIRSFRNRLRTMNRERGGPPDESFQVVASVLDDVLFATTVARFLSHILGDRFRLQNPSFTHTAISFVQQVQLYIDRSQYRDQINLDFATCMQEIEQSLSPNQRIHIIAHSLGTVVAFRALLLAARNEDSWLQRVDRLVTFGSPIDLLLLLFPQLFSQAKLAPARRIEWTNYCFGNDPIATDLAIARAWLASNAPNLFTANSPDEVDLGPGATNTAHTDYWSDDDMLHDIYLGAEHNLTTKASTEAPETNPNLASVTEKKSKSQSERAGPPRQTRQSWRLTTPVFLFASIVAACLVAGCIILWWEENLKSDDGQRLVLLNPILQLLCWVAATAMVSFHVHSYCGKREWRILYFFGCVIATIILVVALPGMPFLDGVIDTEQFNFKNVITNENWTAFNLILFLVPLSAVVGVIQPNFTSTSISSRRWTFGTLICITLFLSIAVGTRDNPSNLVEEIVLLASGFGLWWFSLLLARINHAFAVFVGGREHLDGLCRMWRIKFKIRDPRNCERS